MSSQNTSSSDGSLTDDDSDDERANSTHGRDDTDEHGGQLYNDKGSNEINKHMMAKIGSFVYWTVFGDKGKLRGLQNCFSYICLAISRILWVTIVFV